MISICVEYFRIYFNCFTQSALSRLLADEEVQCDVDTHVISHECKPGLVVDLGTCICFSVHVDIELDISICFTCSKHCMKRLNCKLVGILLKGPSQHIEVFEPAVIPNADPTVLETSLPKNFIS